MHGPFLVFKPAKLLPFIQQQSGKRACQEGGLLIAEGYGHNVGSAHAGIYAAKGDLAVVGCIVAQNHVQPWLKEQHQIIAFAGLAEKLCLIGVRRADDDAGGDVSFGTGLGQPLFHERGSAIVLGGIFQQQCHPQRLSRCLDRNKGQKAGQDQDCQKRVFEEAEESVH